MKRFLPLLIVMILIVSIIGIGSVSAGASISGKSEVLAGRTYTYKGTASYTATSLICAIRGLGVWKDGDGGGSDTDSPLTATASIEISIPSDAKPGDKYTIEFWGNYQAGGNQESFKTTKTITVVEQAPTTTKDPNATPRPPEGWEIVEESMVEAEKGAVVKSEMKDDYKIPESLLKKAVENENILEIDFGTYRCTIDPAELNDFEGIKSLDLKLDFEKAAGLSEFADGKDVYQLHFGHSGQLPGKLTFTFEATENQPGDIVYLYYFYGEAEIVEGKMSAVVDENGMVTFDIYHCSSYFVTSEVIEGALSNFDTESAATIEELTTALDEKQTELDAANTQIETLTTENTTLETAVEDAENEVEDLKAAQASAEANNKDQGEYSLVVLIAAVAAGVLLAILLTMLFTKAGLFRRTDEEKEAQAEKKAAKLLAKQDAKQQVEQAKQHKEQAKQAALEAKQQAKIDAMEAKQQAKQAASQPDDAVQQASGEDDNEL